MSDQIWKCAGCGTPEPFCCKCPTEVAYAQPGLSAWKSDITKRYSIGTKVRWRLFQMLSGIGWMLCPEPHRSLLHGNMRFDPNWKRFTVVPPPVDKGAVDKSKNGENP